MVDNLIPQWKMAGVFGMLQIKKVCVAAKKQ